MQGKLIESPAIVTSHVDESSPWPKDPPEGARWGRRISPEENNRRQAQQAAAKRKKKKTWKMKRQARARA